MGIHSNGGCHVVGFPTEPHPLEDFELRAMAAWIEEGRLAKYGLGVAQGGTHMIGDM